MKDQGTSLNKQCPCPKAQCPIHGNCVPCVKGHLEHRRHLPACMQDLLREDIAKLAAKLESDLSPSKPSERREG